MCVGLLLAVLSLLMLTPAQHLRSLRDGVQASATLHEAGSCILGDCRVKFEANEQTVVANLPVGSSGGKRSVGDQMTVRHQADDPQVVAREDDLYGGGAAVLAMTLGVTSLLCLLLSVMAAVHAMRQRHSRTTSDRTA
ncbi:Syd protein [Streptomyces sp. NBRC 110611]|nr:Syd protein [Streptomyces sp. NBRC 110611]